MERLGRLALIGTLLLISMSYPAGAESLELDLDGLSRLAIAESLGIKVLEMADKSSQEAVPESYARYDTHLFFSGSYAKQEKPSVSVFGSGLEEGADFEVGAKKFFATGTEIEVKAFEDRHKANSSFVTFDPSFVSEGTLTVRQNVLKNFFGSSDRLGVRQIELEAERFNYETLERIEAKLFEIREAYWLLLEERHNLMNEKIALKDAWRFHQITKEKQTLGLAEKPDDFAALSNVKKKEINVLIAENRLKDREHVLKTLLSIPLSGAVVFKSYEEPVESKALEIASWIKLAMVQRFDRQAALLETQKRNLALEMKSFELWPRVDIEASLTTNALKGNLRDSLRQAGDAEFPTYAITLDGEWPLENREAVSRFRQAKWENQRALYELDRIEQEIQRDVDEAVRELELSYERVQRRQAIVQLELDKLDAETQRYRQGRSSSDVVIDYQNDYLLARIAENRALSRFRIAEDALERSASGLIKPYYSAKGTE